MVIRTSIFFIKDYFDGTKLACGHRLLEANETISENPATKPPPGNRTQNTMTLTMDYDFGLAMQPVSK
jgi:hypothetical protein